ncbi:MAG: hypothetical protein CMO01_22365 [Thalassobius sp.]|nr:hypothetical protein [Thalassovita sp.]
MATTLIILMFTSYIIVAYLSLLWGSLDSISAGAMLKEPALYTHLLRFDRKVLPLAIVVPWIYILGVYIIALFIGIFLGIAPKRGAPTPPIYAQLAITIFALPLITFTILFFRSILIVHCAVCKGSGKLNGHNQYLNTHFEEETCFCCEGKRVIWKKSEKGKSHTLLKDNLLLEEDKGKKIEKLQKEYNKLNTKLETKGLNTAVKSNIQTLIDKINDQIAFQQAAKNFYKTAVEKLMILLYNKYLAEYVLGKTKEFNEMEELNIDTFADTEAKKYQIQSDTQIIDRIEVLVQEIALNQQLSIVKELQKELEEATESIKIE